jgi:hypothetical protein
MAERSGGRDHLGPEILGVILGNLVENRKMCEFFVWRKRNQQVTPARQ